MEKGNGFGDEDFAGTFLCFFCSCFVLGRNFFPVVQKRLGCVNLRLAAHRKNLHLPNHTSSDRDSQYGTALLQLRYHKNT